MVTLTFVFNKNKVKKAGYMEDDLFQPMREHAQKYDISEIEYISYFDHWTLDGEKEACIVETQKWYRKKGIQLATVGG